MVLLNKLITSGRQKLQIRSTMISPENKPAKSVFSKGYFCLGLLLFTAFALQEFDNFNWPWLAQLQADDVYKQLSGFGLVGYLGHQWRCSLLRNQGLMQKAAKLLNQHKLLGALAPVFFYAHAQHIGYAYLQALSLVYFAVFLTGLCNVEITRIRKHWFRNVWITVHVGLATSLVFLLGYHIYISYAYQ
ncbi:MAG: hypothetical protein PHD43_15285 [Methylococcales bacterium]|nr:hypothetical protein [Methylococcales bacterium]